MCESKSDIDEFLENKEEPRQTKNETSKGKFHINI